MRKSVLPVLLFSGIVVQGGAVLAPTPQRSLLTSRRSTGEQVDEVQGNVGKSVNFVLNHLPKCGGLFIQSTLQGNIQNFKLEREEASLQKSDSEDFVVGMIRNPLDYYASHWAFLSTSDRPSNPRIYLKNHYPQTLTNCQGSGCVLGSTSGEKEAFKRFIQTVNNETLGQLSLRFWGSYMGSPPNMNFHNTPVVNDYLNNNALNGQKGNASQTIMEAMDDFTSLKKVPVDCWIRQEKLNTDMLGCVKQYEKIPGSGKVDWRGIAENIGAPSIENESPHAHCKDLYDHETLKLVAEADKRIFHAFGYPTKCPE